MNTLELQHYLKSYNNIPSTIIRVCAIDQLPRKLKRNYSYGFVINLSRKHEYGSHWIGLFISRTAANTKRSERTGYFLDSYGFKPRSVYLTDFIKKHCTHVEYCDKQLQQLNSKVCGMYAACFIIHMVSGYPFRAFVGKFSKNLVINDSFIIKNYNYYLRNSL